MIHTANEFTQQHHRFLVAGTTIGLHPINGGEAGGGQDATASAEKSAKRSSVSNSKAPTAFAVPSQRWGTQLLACPFIMHSHECCKTKKELQASGGIFCDAYFGGFWGVLQCSARRVLWSFSYTIVVQRIDGCAEICGFEPAGSLQE